MTSLFMKEEWDLKPFIYFNMRRRLEPSYVLLFMEANSTWHRCMSTAPLPHANTTQNLGHNKSA